MGDERPKLYGKTVDRSMFSPMRSVLVAPQVSRAGNLVLEVGREIDANGLWTKSEHVVLTRPEAWLLVGAICDAMLEHLNQATPRFQSGGHVGG